MLFKKGIERIYGAAWTVGYLQNLETAGQGVASVAVARDT
jgi:hypothetical protein